MLEPLVIFEASKKVGLSVPEFFALAGKTVGHEEFVSQALKNFERHYIVEGWIEKFCYDVLNGKFEVKKLKAKNLLGGLSTVRRTVGRHDLEDDSCQ